MFLFVGLGNPGPKYELTRHNIGFLVADGIASGYGFGPFRARFQALVADGRIGDGKILLMKPTTYMNESGRAVGEAMRFFKVPPEKVIVFHDEMDLAPGKLRVKRGGGSGGHNGIRSLDAHIGRDYRRVRLGVGHPGDKDRVKDYVLNDFTKAEREGWLRLLVAAVADEADMLLRDEEGAFMSRVSQAVFPQRPKPPRPKSPDAKLPGTKVPEQAPGTRNTEPDNRDR